MYAEHIVLLKFFNTGKCREYVFDSHNIKTVFPVLTQEISGYLVKSNWLLQVIEYLAAHWISARARRVDRVQSQAILKTQEILFHLKQLLFW